MIAYLKFLILAFCLRLRGVVGISAVNTGMSEFAQKLAAFKSSRQEQQLQRAAAAASQQPVSGVYKLRVFEQRLEEARQRERDAAYRLRNMPADTVGHWCFDALFVEERLTLDKIVGRIDRLRRFIHEQTTFPRVLSGGKNRYRGILSEIDFQGMLSEYECLLCTHFPIYCKEYYRNKFRFDDSYDLPLFDMPTIEGAIESDKVETVKSFPRSYKIKDDALEALYVAREALSNLEKLNLSKPDVADSLTSYFCDLAATEVDASSK